MKLHKVLMIGGTDYNNYQAVDREIKQLVKVHGASRLLVISGGATGADTMSEVAAHENNVHTAVVKALWKTRHRGAGPQRNSVMIALEPAEAIAFGGDNGTEDSVRKLRKAGIPVRRVK
jgi:predicted Rossmann fold nucleotide-binding protein DprA/Smf involved in DNA uptake